MPFLVPFLPPFLPPFFVPFIDPPFGAQLITDGLKRIDALGRFFLFLGFFLRFFWVFKKLLIEVR
jgi:hypothetical protein